MSLGTTENVKALNYSHDEVNRSGWEGEAEYVCC